MIENNPDKLVERYLADCDLMRVPRRTPTGEDAGDVDHSSVRMLLERAIREAWVVGGAYGLAIAAQPRTIVVHQPLDSLMDNVFREIIQRHKADGGLL